MHIVVTDELLDEFYKEYYKEKELFKNWNINHNITFEQFVKRKLSRISKSRSRVKSSIRKKRGFILWLKRTSKEGKSVRWKNIIRCSMYIVIIAERFKNSFE